MKLSKPHHLLNKIYHLDLDSELSVYANSLLAISFYWLYSSGVFICLYIYIITNGDIFDIPQLLKCT